MRGHKPCASQLLRSLVRDARAQPQCQDAILVSPAGKRAQHVFVCPHTPRARWEAEHLACEEDLRRVIFGMDGAQEQPAEPSQLKIKCASCMLEREPNSTVVVAGPAAVVGCVVADAERGRHDRLATDGDLHHVRSPPAPRPVFGPRGYTGHTSVTHWSHIGRTGVTGPRARAAGSAGGAAAVPSSSQDTATDATDQRRSP